ncbi:MAG: fused MFS/spermidine synthase [Pirellulaceae bacterium]
MTRMQKGPEFAWLAAITVLVGAFLLFQVQPVISKIILPGFGGGPSVWTTCLLFFQILLVGGYAYAHLLSRHVPIGRQAWVHGILVLLSLLTLPILPGEAWKPADVEYPMLRILLLLFVSVGVPYLLLSATGPLVQAWFARRYPDRSPYRLYALSNVGSLGALLTYPFLVEPAMTSSQQAWSWSILFVVYASLAILLAVLFARFLKTASAKTATVGKTTASERAGKRTGVPSASVSGEVSRWQRISWLLLPALATWMLMAVTNYLCQDVAVIPFFWIIPLSLYLLTFIICFDRPGWYRSRLFMNLSILAALAVSILYMGEVVDGIFKLLGSEKKFSLLAQNLTVNTLVHLALLLVVCMFCHGELVKRKPPSSQLTSFYLFVSVGGALGGVIVSILCPLLFPDYWELNIGILIVFLLAAAMVIRDVLGRPSLMQACVTVTLGMVLGFVGNAQWTVIDQRDAILVTRNFYGVLAVRETDTNKPELHQRRLVNGKTLHGLQQMAPGRRREPTSYYGRQSGVGIAIERYRRGRPLRIGAIGLGVGTIACYGKEGDEIDFFEINPDVIRLARSHFSFLEDCPVRPTIIQGDARLSLEKMGRPREYDIMVLDAFSSDAIPVHLLTAEAVGLYGRHLKPGGVIAIHVSNRHLRLVPVVTTLARHGGFQYAKINSSGNGDWLDDAVWILLTKSENFLKDPQVLLATSEPTGPDARKVHLWTDKYTNLLEILRPIE